MSSSLLTKEIDWSKYGVVFASSQMLTGSGGMTVAVVREDLFGQQANKTPTPLNWQSYQGTNLDMMFTSPNTWSIYILGLQLDLLLILGGVGEMHARSLALLAVPHGGAMWT